MATDKPNHSPAGTVSMTSHALAMTPSSADTDNGHVRFFPGYASMCIIIDVDRSDQLVTPETCHRAGEGTSRGHTGHGMHAQTNAGDDGLL